MGGITVSDLSTFYQKKLRPIGIVIDDETLYSQAIKATSFYEGYGGLTLAERESLVDAHTPLNKSEWAVIFPLFELYVERENALILEASRTLGVEVYGRTVSEINNDIIQKEQEIQNLAFYNDFITI